MKGSDRSRRDRKNDCSRVGTPGRMKLSVTVYKRAKVPNVATVFSNTYSGRILCAVQYVSDGLAWSSVARTCLSVGTPARTREWG